MMFIVLSRVLHPVKIVIKKWRLILISTFT